MFAKRRSYRSKILLTVALIALVYGFLKKPHIENLADYLKSDDTVIYAELPLELHPFARKLIQEKTGIALDIDELSNAVNAITLIRTKDPNQNDPHTFVVLQPANEEAQKKITDFFIGAKTTAGVVNLAASSKSVIVAAHDQKDFQFAQSLFSTENTEEIPAPLTKQKAFLSARDQHREYPYFVFAQPKIDQAFFMLPIQEQMTLLPLSNSISHTVEAHFDVQDDGIRGELISTQAKDSDDGKNRATEASTESVEQPYRALTLSLFPVDPDTFVGGTSIASILQETVHVNQKLITSLAAEYLPGIEYEKEIAPLLTGEFGFITRRRQNYTATLFATQLSQSLSSPNILLEKIANSFAEGASSLAFTTQPFILRDGTEALERVPETNKLNVTTEKIGEDTVFGVTFGQYDEMTPQGFYAAITHNKLLVSNDSQLLAQAISRAQEPGLSFRDGELYRTGLQPLLKNPQLTGVMHLKLGNTKGLYSFSKRKFADYSETQFQFMLE